PFHSSIETSPVDNRTTETRTRCRRLDTGHVIAARTCRALAHRFDRTGREPVSGIPRPHPVLEPPRLLAACQQPQVFSSPSFHPLHDDADQPLLPRVWMRTEQ